MISRQELSQQIASELGLTTAQTLAVLDLFEESATIPFIARYRKERTGGLDEVQIRAIEERRDYLNDINARRDAILASIDTQGKLTPELKKQIENATTKSVLEDLYLPYKPKRRTRAMIAREKGLEPLAKKILSQPTQGIPQEDAIPFIDSEKGIENIQDALDGANDIIAETIAEQADVRDFLRQMMNDSGLMIAECTDKAQTERSKFEQYYHYRAPLHDCKGHRYLAIRRGENDGFLRAKIEVDTEKAINTIAAMMQINHASPYAQILLDACHDAFDRLLVTSIESDVRVSMKQDADHDAVDVFAKNVECLLLAPPLGAFAVIGIDPGLRTGCKCVALDETGKFLENITIFPETGNEQKARHELMALLNRHPSKAIAIGNGTAGRETEAFVRKLTSEILENIRPYVVMVSESGASIYSASDIAREEFPYLDITVRGAISIARRLQDPLAELVKIDPKSIGVGQYQHDVFQPLLKRKLEEVVESCVNRVGVELNTASAELLKYVAGIGPSMAKKIIAFRESHGQFTSRAQLLKVPGLGPKTFEQSAGFIRVRESENPLDHSAVHPERYPLVEKMAQDLGLPLNALVGNASLAAKIPLHSYISSDVGLPTLNDIIAEIQKPGRDPRAKFEPPKFNENISKIDDLEIGMILNGIVTNVTNFGAFVDIGVHQDGLVHISALCDKFVSNPADVVTVGDTVKVRVIDLDIPRKRIALSCKLQDAPSQKTPEKTQKKLNTAAPKSSKKIHASSNSSFSNNPFANLKH